MKRFMIVLAALILVADVAYGKDYEVNKKAGDYSVAIRIDRNPPVAGDNNVEIAVTDNAGKNVSDAKVIINYSMPAMAGMPAMSYKAEAQPKGNVYRTKVNYSMAGPWNNEVRVTRGGKTQTAKFTVDVK